jgi:hypothetical protein
MRLSWVQWIIAVLALQQAGWMTYDGLRALIVGDYVTPRSGEYAGQLGPWTHLVEAVGLQPRSTLMKAIFVVAGVAWLLILIAFITRQPWAWTAMLAAAIGTLWYLPIGTLFSVIQIVLLLVPLGRRGFETPF